ncbi:MAG TPA: GTP-binding protein [Stellaceae bacterium]|nr:GTP-binding protein [Stellaceae bacterium]
MSIFAKANARDRLPVSLVTGFLGSGKTSLLNRLLRHPEMANTAIVINEFGEIALDQHFIERSDGEVVVMANGCLCCTVQGDLEGVVGTLFGKRAAGAVPSFDRMLIETTGLADPAPIMQLLLSKPLIVDNFALDAVVATIDAVHGARQLEEHGEAVKQAALADRLVVTKTDLAAADAVEELVSRLAAMNPSATIARLPHGDLAPGALFGASLHGPGGRMRDPASWLGGDHDEREHLHGIDTFALTIARPVEWRAFSRWLTRIKIRHADDLLRVKGIVNVAGEDGMVAIHGVHHVFHPPVRLERRSGDDATSRIVFITRGTASDQIEAEWRAFTEEQ